MFHPRHFRNALSKPAIQLRRRVAAGEGKAGDPSRPPLSCRTSPPQGGRLAVLALRPFLRR
ncbi:MAG: hypothetical protein E5Y10_09325 [Mesorhizobium sp.]|nr:MAG: hypothetical protein EOS13_30980 [Mesorhizobium sp.]TIN27590.1 MAG: hypothetical protein E5Y19_09895 [Mesorhizobium sp.]TIN40397.1 MAG: hypothetical protein E5Y13_11430 [Mesorhizobium sp.]TJU87373.1 MAG: hypothetical protein E5Y15_07005 [Mesorhizobium sp.]TJU90635.1 MAG: hypothetical protein E5Y10_09325 [Mesorhizobium sp.]